MKRTTKGYAFECRANSNNEVYLAETVDGISRKGYYTKRFITAVTQTGSLTTPYLMKVDKTEPLTKENLESVLRGHIKVLDKLSEAVLIVCVYVYFRPETNDYGIEEEFFSPREVVLQSETYKDRKGKPRPCVLCERLGTTNIIGMHMKEVSPVLLKEYENIVTGYFLSNNVVNRESFLISRLK